MSTTDTTASAPAESPPLDEVMLAMDVVDTLRHRQDLVERELSGDARERQLIEKLRDIYSHQGIEVSDEVLKAGVKALDESRFVYTPPKPSLATTLARFYVGRRKWGPAVIAVALVLVLGLGGYFLAWQPYQNAQRESARIELSETLPAKMDALYQTIYDETKVQQAVTDAEALRTRGKAAAAEGNRAGAEQAVTGLTALRDQLRQEFSLRIVNRQDVKTGFWTFPEVNTDATNYYLVVEAIDPSGKALTLPIVNEETSETENVAIWGVRVPESVYKSVEQDKLDDGIIQRNVMGMKEYGFLDVDYVMPVLGGAVTRW
jgi:anti-sigma-K factor RskA